MPRSASPAATPRTAAREPSRCCRAIFRKVTADDVKALVEKLSPAPCCVVAPDHQEQGTNALALAPAEHDFFRFGPDSFQAHLAAAKARGMKVRILRRPGLAHDLDTPEEYRCYAKEQLAQSGALA
jgi:hypothetical protein